MNNPLPTDSPSAFSVTPDEAQLAHKLLNTVLTDLRYRSVRPSSLDQVQLFAYRDCIAWFLGLPTNPTTAKVLAELRRIAEREGYADYEHNPIKSPSTSRHHRSGTGPLGSV